MTTMENLPALRPDTEMVNGTLTPCSFEGLYRMSKIMAASGLMPKGVQSVEAVFVAVQNGLELGLSPMQAVSCTAVINGRPSIYGDTVLALVRRSGLLEDFSEAITGSNETLKAVCTAKRKGETSPIVREFTYADAKQAGLWGKDGPWRLYPKRMMQMRARSFALRDGFGDVLKGLRVAEEVMDYDADLQVTGNGTYAAADIDDAIQEPQESQFDKLSVDIAGPDLDAFIRSIAKKGKHTVDEIKADACKRWDSFVKAFIKFQAKNQPESVEAKPEPVQAEPVTESAPEHEKELPISATPEYKRLMEMKNDFRELYLAAKKDAGVEPDSVENCLMLAAAINQMIDMDNDR